MKSQSSIFWHLTLPILPFWVGRISKICSSSYPIWPFTLSSTTAISFKNSSALHQYLRFSQNISSLATSLSIQIYFELLIYLYAWKEAQHKISPPSLPLIIEPLKNLSLNNVSSQFSSPQLSLKIIFSKIKLLSFH